MYFRMRSIPELRHLTPDWRQRVIRAFDRKRRSRVLVRYVELLVNAVLLMPAIIAFCFVMYHSQAMMVAGTSAIAVCIISLFRIERKTRHDVARFLDDMHTNGRLRHCLECDYNLKGSTSDTCPECGAEVVLKHVEPRMDANQRE